MKPGYLPDNVVGRLFHLGEECGEVQAAAGKTGRFGMESSNPDLPPEQREINAAWLLREITDLEAAIHAIKPDLADAVERHARKAITA